MQSLSICSSSSSLGRAISPQHKWGQLMRCRVAAGGSSSPSSGRNMNGFIKRMEQTWLISKQPKPVPCGSCEACGRKECPWCKGTGFFILGDNMLCEVSSHNTACYICTGQGTVDCEHCKGTGYRAKWLTSS